jgi:hypothetical protein
MILKMKRKKYFVMVPADLLPQLTTSMSKPYYTKPIKFYISYWYLSSRADGVLSKK